jgi:hypothetical protein
MSAWAQADVTSRAKASALPRAIGMRQRCCAPVWGQSRSRWAGNARQAISQRGDRACHA